MTTETAHTPLVLYHANCPDGHCAAWLLHKIFPDATFLPCQYGDARPDCTDRNVYLLDFSFPRDAMLAIARQARSLVTLDHHQSAQAALLGFDEEVMQDPRRYSLTIFDMQKSGARLTWDYLSDRVLQTWTYAELCEVGLQVRPWLVDYTEDRDLWRFRLHKSQEINAALFSYPRTFAVWDDLHVIPATDLVNEGAAILRRDQMLIAEHLARAYTLTIGGHQVPVVNATTLFSDIAGELAKGQPFGVCWFQRGDGQVQYSLRSDDQGLDVSEIAKLYGGGGHKHAAGFTTKRLSEQISVQAPSALGAVDRTG